MLFSRNSIRIEGRRAQQEISLPRGMRGVKLRVQGRGNTVRLASAAFHGTISVCGKDNTLIIEEGVSTGKDCTIQIGVPGAPCFGATVIIGRNTFLGEVDIRTAEDDSRVDIGADCMFSVGVRLWGTDGHMLRHADGRLNIGRAISIGRHVWVGADVRIGKNTTIADDCVVGWGSTVRGRFAEPASVIAGNPAAVCNSGVTWSADLVAQHQEGARIHTEKDWQAADPAPLLLRPFLSLRLALCLARIRRTRRADKRDKYTRQADKLRRRLGR